MRKKSSISVPCYLRLDMAYIPSVAFYENGLGTDGEPITIVPVQDTGVFRQALMDTAARPPLILPTPPDRFSYPKSVLPKYANVKTWGAFFKDAHFWTLEKSEATSEISFWRKDRAHKGWLGNRTPDVVFPSSTSFEIVCQKLVDMVQEAARLEIENKPRWKK